MALSRGEAEHLARLQRQLHLRAQLETEQALFRLVRSIGGLTQLIEPLRSQFIDAIMEDRLDEAERLEEELGQTVSTWLRETFAELERRTIEQVIRNAAMRGAQAVDLAPALARTDLRTLDALLNALSGAGGRSGGTITAQYGRIADVVQRQIEQRVYRDGLNLSRRLHVRLLQREAEFKHILATGLQEGRGAIRIAKQLAELDVTDARLPKYLLDLERTLKGTKDARLVDELRRAAREATRRKEGPLGLRGPAMKVVRAARTGSAEKLDEAIQYFLERKVRYHSLVIARTEANNAFRAGHVEQAKASPWVRGIKWNLSASHRIECECEVLAEQDLYGLGPGVYPPDRLPERPHPNCFCFFTDVVDLDFVA